MIDDQVVVTAERLRDELVDLRKSLRARYREPTRQVTADDLRGRASRSAETWMVELAVRDDVRTQISSDYLADLNVQFQRILTSSEHASQRKRYDAAIQAILSRFTLDFVIPLKQARHQRGSSGATTDGAGGSTVPPILPATGVPGPEWHASVFVGHSLAKADAGIAERVIQCLTALGLSVESGDRPKADRISDKIKRVIDAQYLFVGIFTRRDKVARKHEWTTSSWVVDEKAYAVGKGKKLVLLKEGGVGSIGGIQGDYEFIEFSRDHLDALVVSLVQLFEVNVRALKK